jgi:hypothetical protein
VRKIETMLRGERFERVKGECDLEEIVYYGRDKTRAK